MVKSLSDRVAEREKALKIRHVLSYRDLTVLHLHTRMFCELNAFICLSSCSGYTFVDPDGVTAKRKLPSALLPKRVFF